MNLMRSGSIGRRLVPERRHTHGDDRHEAVAGESTPSTVRVIISYPAKRYGSAWIGIAVHSAQSLFFAVVVLGPVIS